MEAAAQAGEFDDALKITWEIESEWARASALVEIAVALTHIEKIEIARMALVAALESTENIEDGWSQSKALVEIAVAQEQVGKRAAVRVTLDAVGEIEIQ